ncbi:hypothetical protein [Formosa sp. Hel1_31_208]|uniref:hypothetical protein n=1 Tax=Formosa sp. Hel1_31_208 TaxID=1798225 RepID=UPI0012FD317D|nr:hypothetical protein [Formosa sp. Hel1_31_208]
MHITTTSEMTCSVFGHNLKRSAKHKECSEVLICKTCKSEVLIDMKGEFESLPIKNKAIKIALRQLFLLESQYSRKRFSA